ncbi:MAG: hypothetical protein ACRDT6_25435 [Micromonosporaceae bacterium]
MISEVNDLTGQWAATLQGAKPEKGLALLGQVKQGLQELSSQSQLTVSRVDETRGAAAALGDEDF